METKSLEIRVLKVKRTRKTIEMSWKQGVGGFALAERDNPLPSFNAAVDALAPLVATICHLPTEYVQGGCRVVGFTIEEQAGADAVSILVKKQILDAPKEFAFKTPARLLAHPSEPGTYSPPLSVADAAVVYTAIDEAKRYIRGERAQGLISFDEEGGGGGDDDFGGESTAGEGERTIEMELSPSGVMRRKGKRSTGGGS